MNHFSRRQISNAIVEVTPGHGFWENVDVTQEEVAETLSRVASFGYKMVSLYDYSIHNTADEVYDYILKATFSKQHGQSDIWLTLDDVDASVIAEIRARCTSISKSRARVADSGRLELGGRKKRAEIGNRVRLGGPLRPAESAMLHEC